MYVSPQARVLGEVLTLSKLKKFGTKWCTSVAARVIPWPSHKKEIYIYICAKYEHIIEELG